MHFRAGEWKLWRGNTDFEQRFTATLGAAGRTLTGRWEKSSNGGEWEHDFHVEYTRAV
jgi:hypothetical protein